MMYSLFFLTSKFRRFFYLLRRDRLYLKLRLQLTLIRWSKFQVSELHTSSTGSLNHVEYASGNILVPHKLQTYLDKTYLNNNNVLLIVLHINPFTGVGGVEKETYSLISHLKKGNKNLDIAVYYYEKNSCKLNLVFMHNYNIKKLIAFDDNLEACEVFNWIIENFKVKAVVAEHLMNHSVEYGEICKRKKLGSVLFIHDFYYITPKLYSENDRSQTVKNYTGAHTAKSRRTIPIKKLLSNHFNYIIFNSEYTREKYLEHFSLSNKAKYVVSYPIP